MRKAALSRNLLSRNLLASSALAMAASLMCAAHAARAQSFDAAGTVVGGAAIITTAPGKTTVAANGPNVVIDWAPNDISGSGPINFQPAGTTALFTNGDSTSFAVLNRIIPTDPTRSVVFNGTVTSQLQDLSTGAISRGGTLFFYSPGGILVGSNGVFDVGNLVLTSSDLAYDPISGAFDSSGSYKFLSADPASSVEVRAGARITAGPTSAYVALIAPKVVNSGLIDVDGSAVLVAANASTITFRTSGLFDIQIDEGTGAAGEVVVNDGTITGAAGTAGAAHRIYMVAVPKNDAITLAIRSGSTLGFAIAAAADVVGNAIVLSAGYDVSGDTIGTVRSAAGGAVPATLAIGAIAATSQVTGQATGQALLQIQSGEAANFASNLNIAGVFDPAAPTADSAIVSVGGVGSTLQINGDLGVTSLDAGLVTGTGPSDRTPARIVVNDGALTVHGNATVDASRQGFSGNTAQGGEAGLVVGSGAVVTFDKDLVLNGDGVGQPVNDASSLGSFPGVGGFAHVSFGGGAAVTVNGNLAVHAAGYGGVVLGSGYPGASGTGGSALIEGLANGGSLTVSGSGVVDARGVGADGFYCLVCVIEGGVGTGGVAGISSAKGATIDIGGVTNVDASGLGGAATIDSGKSGAAGLGGQAFLDSTGGAIIARGAASVLAEGLGGDGASSLRLVSGSSGPGGAGGLGGGGRATITAGDAGRIGAGGSIAVTGSTVVSADGTGGDGGTGGATGSGGFASVSARNGTISGAGLVTRAVGLGGNGTNGGSGGAGSGGTAQVIAYSALEGDATVTFNTTTITARGTGGAGSTPAFGAGIGGTGGAGTGGIASALAEAGNGHLSLAGTSITAIGIGGNGGTGGVDPVGIGSAGGAGGDGIGGTATFGVVSGLDTGAVNTGSAALSGASVLGYGTGGGGGAGGTGSVIGAGGSGGDAQGGRAALIARGGLVALKSAVLVEAYAVGGSGGAGSGGDVGGNAAVGDNGSAVDPLGVRLEVGSRDGHPDQTGHLTATALTLTATSSGGKGSTPGSAAILGQPLTFLLDHGAIDAGSVDFLASGTAASGALPSAIALTVGDTTLTGNFSFVTSGTLTASLDGGNLGADTVLVSGSNWLPGTAPAGVSGTLTGTTSVTLLSGDDLFGYLSASTGGTLSLSAAGLVRFDNLTATGDITVDAGTTASLGDIATAGSVLLLAASNAAVGNVTAGADTLLTSGGTLAAKSVRSGQSARLEGTAGLTLGGDLVVGNAALLVSDGAITGAGLSAGLVSPSAASGATYDITVFGKGTIALGDVSAAGAIKLFTPGSLFVGVLAGSDIAVLAGGAQSIGGLTATGRALIADYAMVSAGGDPLGAYDLNAVFAAAPVAAGGSITILGSAKVGSLTAVSVSDVSSEPITASGFVDLRAGGTFFARSIVAGGAVSIAATGDLSLGSASAGGILTLGDGGVIRTGDLSGTNGVIIGGATAVTTGAVQAKSGSIAITAAGDLASGSLSSSGDATLTSTSGGIALGAVKALGGAIAISAANAVSVGGLTAEGGIAVSAGPGLLITGTTISAAGDVVLASTGDMAANKIAAKAGRVLISATGKVSAGNLSATGAAVGAGLRINAGTSIDAGTITVAAGGLQLNSGGALTSGALAARGGALTVTSGGPFAARGLIGRDGIAVTAGDDTLLTGAVSSAAGDVTLKIAGALAGRSIGSSAGQVRITADTNIAVGALSALTELTVTSGGSLAAGNLKGSAVTASAGTTLSAGKVTATGGAVALTAAGDLTSGGVISAGAVSLASTGGKVTGGAISAGFGVTLKAIGDLSTAAITSGGALDAQGARVALGNVRAVSAALKASAALNAGKVNATGGGVSISAAGDLSSEGVTATSTISLASSGGKVTGGAISAGSGVTLAALGDLTTAAITAGGALDAQGAGVNLGNVRALSIGTSATTTLTVGKVTATSGVVALTAVGDLASGTISASGAVSLTSSGGAVTGGAIGAGGDVALAAAGDLNAGTIAAGGTFDARGANLTLGDAKATRIAVLAGAALNIGAVDAGAGAIALTAGGAFKSGSLTATGAVDLASGAALSAGDVNAGQAVQAVAGGAATFGSVRSQTGTVELRSTGGALATGAVQAATDTALIAAGGLAVNAVAARDMVLLAGSGVSADSLTSSGGRILIGNAVMAAPGGSFGAFVYDAVFAAPLRQTGGTLAIGGKVSGAAVTAAIGGDAAMATVVASGTLLVDSGGTVQLGGLWQAPQIEIRANDIAIPAGAGLDAGRAGTILLVSRNTAGMRIGDGLDGSIVPASGYSLDNAEWSRIRSGSLTVFGLDGPGAVDMLIGTLDVTGPAAGSTIDDPAGKVVFRTGSAPAAAPSGTVRVVGALTARGFGSGNALAFANGQFELASDTGSVAALGAANALSGAVQIDADDIHIAAAPLLARLAADPFFAGAEAALDTQSAGGNQPVLRAGALDLTVGRTLYIQRSGAGANPFGFDAPLAGFTVKPAGARPITVIVNGTFQIAGKAIGGIEAWQTFTQSGVSISGFSPASRLNGCLLIAALCVAPPPDGIQDLIDPVDDPKTNDGAPGNPDKPGPPDEHAIQPPEIVLPVQPDAPPVHIDEPIAGSGNPALTGAAIGQGAGALK